MHTGNEERKNHPPGSSEKEKHTTQLWCYVHKTHNKNKYVGKQASEWEREKKVNKSIRGESSKNKKYFHYDMKSRNCMSSSNRSRRKETFFSVVSGSCSSGILRFQKKKKWEKKNYRSDNTGRGKEEGASADNSRVILIKPLQGTNPISNLMIVFAVFFRLWHSQGGYTYTCICMERRRESEKDEKTKGMSKWLDDLLNVV